jgi:flavin reductase
MIDQQTFRDAMARLAAAVTVVTSDGPGGLCGTTASAVCSVSDTPPILLVCINRSSRNNAVLKENGRLCVNVLRADQQPLALQFSRSGIDAEERFTVGDWLRPIPHSATSAQCATSAPSGAVPAVAIPVLNGALVSLDCRITDTAEVGSHTVFYCTVDAVHFGVAGSAVVYFERGFHAVAPAA